MSEKKESSGIIRNSIKNDILIVIPARGDSKGIPRKNLRILNRKPLIYYSITNALKSTYSPDVYVSSENEEILAISKKIGAKTHTRPAHLSDDMTTLDPVIYDAYAAISAKEKKEYKYIITLQPTSPLLKTSSLDEAIGYMLSNPGIDTLLSATAKVGLSWIKEEGQFVPIYEKRLNRQQLQPVYYETGGFLICKNDVIKPTSRFGKNVQLFELSDREAIDIDTYEEWNLCEYFLRRKKIVFATTGYPEVGLGHIYRSLLLADRIVNHQILFVVDSQSELGYQKICGSNHPVVKAKEGDLLPCILQNDPDVVITDRLDTTGEYVEALNKSGIKTINFEDLGPGSELADVVFNAIYAPGKERSNHYYGPQYYCGRQEFLLSEKSAIQPRLSRILLTFGGTDPNNLTRKTLDAIYAYCTSHRIRISVIAGLGYSHYNTLSDFSEITIFRNVKNISDHMLEADLAFTSAGRTTYELAMLGIPSIVMAQNQREMTHYFASNQNGFVNLGLGRDASPKVILDTLRSFEHQDQRRSMHALMQKTNLRQGVDRVMQIISTTIEDI